jgi:hypothetical protein
MRQEMTIEQRLLFLERSNKQLKAGMLAIGILAGAVGILGAGLPAPKTITAERFVLMDDAGNQRAELSANAKAAALQFLNSDGTRALVIAAGSAGNGIFVSDRKGSARASLIATDDGTANFAMMKQGSSHESFVITDNPQGTALAIRDPNGKDRVNLGYTEKGASLGVGDANGTIRAMVAEQGIASYLKGGQIEWASFGENMTPEERKRVMDLINSAIPR